MNKEERIEGFLKELSSISKKYGLTIGGCGCCGSPFVTDVLTNNDVMEEIRFDSNTQKYSGNMIEERKPYPPISFPDKPKYMVATIFGYKDLVAEEMARYIEGGGTDD